MQSLDSLELCAGGGGTALGLEQAGFRHAAVVELDKNACRTLRYNRPRWQVIEANLRELTGKEFDGIDLLSAGVPCPPFSVAGKQLGERDERDLFPEVLRLTKTCRPKAVLVENVRGLLDPRFGPYRDRIAYSLERLGYKVAWKMLNSCDFGVPQLRPRVLLVALRKSISHSFSWPDPSPIKTPTVGEALFQQMASNGWPKALEWSRRAAAIAPTLVGGSKLHGGPDLGPTRARIAWAKLGIEGRSLANDPPGPTHSGMPKLTLKMAAIIQGFPPEWEFVGQKTQAYRQVGNAFPPPVARAVGERIAAALHGECNSGNEAAWSSPQLALPVPESCKLDGVAPQLEGGGLANKRSAKAKHVEHSLDRQQG